VSPRAAATEPGRLTGAILLSLAFGSIHAFGVLLQPIETRFAVERGIASLPYSIAIACLTAGVLAFGWLSIRLPPRMMALLCGTIAAAGLAACASTGSITVFTLGYGVAFGAANGLAYSLFLGQAVLALPSSPGLAVGLVTAAYGLGAAVWAQVFGKALEHAALSWTVTILAAAMFLAGGLASLLFTRLQPSQVRNHASEPAATASGGIWLYWLIYFLGASGGLMAIAHASGIVSAAGTGPSLALWAPTLIAIGNIVGSLLGGPFAAAVRADRALAAPLVLNALALALVQALPALSMALLVACGLAYGVLIAAVPVVIRQRYSSAGFNSGFGRVFTAWGVAGLIAPVLAGQLFDATQTYAWPITLAACASLVGAILASFNLSIRSQADRSPKEN
jgi:predicted MFS family arabinose efflux permease